MRDERLLERLKRWDAQDMERSLDGPNIETLKASILKHLEKILNTRQGAVAMDPEFGIPDFTHAQDLSLLEQDVARVIERYEPRLKDVVVRKVVLDDFGSNIALAVDANLAEEGVAVHFTTYMTSSGRVRMKY
jgi:type VI secretion system protein